MENISLGETLGEIIKLVENIPGITTLIRILQAAGILFIAYLIFLFIRGILQYQSFTKIKRMEQSLARIDNTLQRIDEKIGDTAKQKIKSKK